MKKMIILALVVTFSQLGLASEKVEGKGLEQMAPEQMRGHKIMVIDEQGNPVASTPDGISDKPGRINQATNYTSSFKGDGS